MNIANIRSKFNNGEYTVKMDIPNKVPENYVFDEDLSVKRNKEMVLEHNRKVDEMRKQKNDQQTELSRQFTYDVIQHILNSYDVSETQARIIEAFVYNERHSSMTDYFSYIDTLCGMIEEVLKVG
jgi:hypothetical protein